MTVGLSPTGNARATEAVRRVLGKGSSESRTRRKGHRGTASTYYGQLLEDLDAPSDGWTAPTTARMRVYLPDPLSTADPVAFIAADEDGEPFELDVVNRDPSLSGSTGAFIKVELCHNEWSPYWLGCP